MDEEIRRLIVDLHSAMSEEKEGHFPQPRLDRIERAILRLAEAMGPDVAQVVRRELEGAVA